VSLLKFSEQAVKVMQKKSDSRLRQARNALRDNDLDVCISSLYFSAFQRGLSLMICRGESSKKHEAVRQWLNLNLAKKGLVRVDLIKMYNKLMDSRSDADYTETVFELGEVKSYLQQVIEFNEEIDSLIEQEIKANKNGNQ
jgi:uncharacterized protein (UPF0332 family)